MAGFERLSSPAAFRAAFDDGRSAAQGRLVVYVAPRDPAAPTRVGYVVSRKIGSAVLRNRAKRMLREAVRLSGAVQPTGLDLVIVARPGAAAASFHDLVGDLEKALTVTESADET